MLDKAPLASAVPHILSDVRVRRVVGLQEDGLVLLILPVLQVDLVILQVLGFRVFFIFPSFWIVILPDVLCSVGKELP